MSTVTITPRWQVLLEDSAKHHAIGKDARREAGKLLWLGCKAAIKSWKPSTDPTGMRLYHRTLTALGGHRKSAASKIKTVALATVEYGLDLDAYGSLNAAYGAAYRMALGSETDIDPVCTCTCAHHAQP